MAKRENNSVERGGSVVVGVVGSSAVSKIKERVVSKMAETNEMTKRERSEREEVWV